jgi:putative ABC transport system permease protein
VAVVLSVHLANRGSVRGFEAALDSIAGRTSLQITAGGSGFDEMQAAGLGWVRRYGSLSPVIERDALLTVGDHTEVVKVLGVDVLSDVALRDYRVNSAAVNSGPRELLGLLLDPDAVVLTETFAARHGLSVGSQAPLITGARSRNWRVAALLAAEGPARALDGNIVIMDIAAAQTAFDRLGFLDRIDVRLHRGVEVDLAEAEIAAGLDGGLEVRRPAQRGRDIERMLAAFHFNLAALSSIALLVGLFGVYNAVAVSVVVRRNEVGMLRALGVRRATVLLLFIGEALALACAGVLAGIPAGRLLAFAAARLTSATVAAFWIVSAALPPTLEGAHILAAFGVALPLSALAAVVPALEAMRISPVEAFYGVDGVAARRGRCWRGVAVLLSVVVAVTLARMDAVGGLPLFGYAAGVAAMCSGALLVGPLLRVTGLALVRPAASLAGATGMLAARSVAARAGRLGISMGALSVSLAMTVAVVVLIASFRDTVSHWVEQTLGADIYVRPAARLGIAGDAVMPARAVEEIRALPGVAVVDEIRSFDVRYADSTIRVSGTDYSALRSRKKLLLKDGSLPEVSQTGIAIVSEPFALRNGLGVGDRLALPNGRNVVEEVIGAVYYDYSSDRGVVLVERTDFELAYGERLPSSLALYVEEGVEPEVVRQELIEKPGQEYRFAATTGRELKHEVLRTFDATFAVTYALEVIAVVTALLGVAATLVRLVSERRRELAISRLVGAGARTVRGMLIGEALLIGGVAQVVGLGVGLALSVLLIRVINVQSFGWTIQFSIPYTFLGQVAVAITVAAGLAGLLTSWWALRVDAATVLAEE